MCKNTHISELHCKGCHNFKTMVLKIDEKYMMHIWKELWCKVGKENCEKENKCLITIDTI